MLYFFLGLALLVLGYYTYGRYIEKILAPDDRKTPAVANYDGVDFVTLPHWKNMLIQLLNIAGVGPVIGVILGIKFGDIVFLIIPVGNILAGATHDMLSGMMSMRHGGTNLPALIRQNLGNAYYKFFSWFTILLLLLVVAVFINVPANLIDKAFPQYEIFWLTVGAIFLYYIVATLFPVDKIIGKIYPFFGLMLLVGTVSVFVSICMHLVSNPDLLSETPKFAEMKWCAENPISEIPPKKVVEREILPLSIEQIQRLLKCTLSERHCDCAAAVGIMLWAGIRPKEVSRLTWRDIDLEEHVIVVRRRNSKTGGVRHIDICPPLRHWLGKIKKRNGQICPKNWIRKWHRLRVVAGFKHWTQDVLRHTFATYNLKRFHNLPKLQSEMGHADLSLIRTRYVNMGNITKANAKCFFEPRGILEYGTECNSVQCVSV